MKNTPRLLMAVLALGAMSAAATEGTSAKGFVREQNGAPVPALIQVVRLTSSGQEVATLLTEKADEHGKFEVKGLPPGAWRFKAAYGGRLAMSDREITGSETESIGIVLEAGQVVEGRILVGGAAVSDIPLTLHMKADPLVSEIDPTIAKSIAKLSMSAKTDAQGNFKFVGLGPHPVELTISVPSLQPKTVALLPGQVDVQIEALDAGI